jgi:hypothetical protein
VQGRVCIQRLDPVQAIFCRRHHHAGRPMLTAGQRTTAARYVASSETPGVLLYLITTG